jgi:hypothetical protein
MNEKRTGGRQRARPLLVATAGATFISMGACWPLVSGNLIAPSCDGGTPDPYCQTLADAGTDVVIHPACDGGIPVTHPDGSVEYMPCPPEPDAGSDGGL